MSRPVQLWVDPEFAKKLKIKSAQEDLSIIKLTERLARQSEDLEKPRRRFRLDF